MPNPYKGQEGGAPYLSGREAGRLHVRASFPYFRERRSPDGDGTCFGRPVLLCTCTQGLGGGRRFVLAVLQVVRAPLAGKYYWGKRSPSLVPSTFGFLGHEDRLRGEVFFGLSGLYWTAMASMMERSGS